jgi:hypothetical protein
VATPEEEATADKVEDKVEATDKDHTAVEDTKEDTVRELTLIFSKSLTGI